MKWYIKSSINDRTTDVNMVELEAQIAELHSQRNALFQSGMQAESKEATNQWWAKEKEVANQIDLLVEELGKARSARNNTTMKKPDDRFTGVKVPDDLKHYFDPISESDAIWEMETSHGSWGGVDQARCRGSGRGYLGLVTLLTGIFCASLILFSNGYRIYCTF